MSVSIFPRAFIYVLEAQTPPGQHNSDTSFVCLFSSSWTYDIQMRVERNRKNLKFFYFKEPLYMRYNLLASLVPVGGALKWVETRTYHWV